MDSPFRPDAYAGRHVAITGGSSGIGLAIATAFAAHGAHVTILARNQQRLDEAIAGLPGRGHAGHSVDVRNRDQLDAAAQAMPPVDVLICAAAGNFPVPFTAMSANAWDSVIDIVLQGTANTCRSFGDRLTEGSSVLNIVAGYAWTGAPGLSHSGAAKAGVLNLTKSLAVEWANKTRVNAVSPGPIEGTEGMRRLGTELGLDEVLRKTIPAGKFGSGEDVAQACLFLAGPWAGYVTGTCLPVDGGQDALGPFGGLWQALQG